MSDSFIQSRLHIHSPGYEPLTARQHYDRYVRELARFRALWNASTEISDLEDHDGVSQCHVETQGDGWAVKTRLVYLEWSSGVPRPMSLGYWKGVVTSLPRYFAHYRTLAPFRYFAANWRYGIYFIYPLLMMVVFAAMTLAVLGVVGWLVPGLPGWAMVVAGIILFLALFRYLGERWNIPMVLDVMHFTHSLAMLEEPISLARLDEFTAYLKSELPQATEDELLITYHSNGSVFAVSALARALRDEPDLINGRKLTLMGIGSNMLKLGLMKECEWLRDDFRTLLLDERIQWIEIYANDDVLCFTDTGADATVDVTPANAMVYKRARFSRMIAADRYKRIKGRFFRLHRQLILANEKPHFYDFHLLSCGPRRALDCLNRSDEQSI